MLQKQIALKFLKLLNTGKTKKNYFSANEKIGHKKVISCLDEFSEVT